jgi:hypothetical protein
MPSANTMRSEQVFDAIKHVPNCFLLIKLASKATQQKGKFHHQNDFPAAKGGILSPKVRLSAVEWHAHSYRSDIAERQSLLAKLPIARRSTNASKSLWATNASKSLWELPRPLRDAQARIVIARWTTSWFLVYL